jgi:3-deoxy-D-manno-octulosonic-acid transferase/ectoine hydroxylase-related dioxygenase (phytanoyl-CoA dioxygenase family)
MSAFEPTVHLTQEQIDHYHREGYLALPSISTEEELVWMREVYDRIFSAQAGREEGNQFDLAGTDEEGKKATLPQILNPTKYAPELKEGQFRVNALHIAKQLLGPEAVAMGDHAIYKPAEYGAETPWHQDEAYWNPMMTYNSLSLWIPLQEATTENGCMWFVPKSHNWEVQPHHSINNDPRIHGLEIDEADTSQAVACPIPAGGCTVHHNRTLHYAGANRSETPRRALILGFGTPAVPRKEERVFYWNDIKETPREARSKVARGETARLLYNGLLFLLSPFLCLFLLQRFLSGKSRPGWAERWGNLGERKALQEDTRRRVWIHAVSAGEVVAAVPILKQLRTRFPNHLFLMSVITPAGHEMATQQAMPFIDHLFYAPLDFPFVVKRVVRLLRPELYVSLESEMWPNLLHALKQSGCHNVMVNGRISENSFRRSRKVGLLYRWAMGNMDRFLVQSEGDARRVRELRGAAWQDSRVRILGNSKFDQEVRLLNVEEREELRRALKFPPTAPLFIAGSTRSAEEEEIVLSAYLKMREEFPELLLLVAPRQIGRAEELANAMREKGLSPVRKTQIETAAFPIHTLILDTMGELANVYAISTFAFVGNSFPPVVKGGGQNLLQPLAHGKPVIVGPRNATIRSEVQLAVEQGVGFQVATGAEFTDIGLRFLRDSEECARVGQKAMELMSAQRGVSERYAVAVWEVLSEARATAR